MSPSTKQWFTAAQLAEADLPGMPRSRAGVQKLIEREGWEAEARREITWRERKGKGGGAEYHIRNLTPDQQAKLLRAHSPEPEGTPSRPELLPNSISRDQLRAAERWEWFDGKPEGVKAVARKRLEALLAVDALRAGGLGKTQAMRQVAASHGFTVQSLYNWENQVLCLPRADWLPFLAPHYAGGAAQQAECPPDAWEELKADYLRLEAPAFSDCYRRLQKRAAVMGWRLPTERTLRRKIEALPPTVLCLAREGEEVLKRKYPAQQRDRGIFHALEAVNADGHTWDVFVRWPDGSIRRPVMTAFQDLYSGKILSWRVDYSESSHSFRLAFGSLVEDWGIPDRIWLDNTRAAANKTMTGGTSTRFRFKVKAEEPLGILPALGVQVNWTTPYSGQSKPVERAFRDFASGTAKHPAFAGAYTGNSPDAKPENYGSAAVPLDQFLQVVGEAMVEHNARTGRQGGVCRGRSFDQVFAESYEKAPIRRATEAQRRLWLLAAEAVKVRADGSVHLAGNRYWADQLSGLIGHAVTLRFDPDALHEPVQLYRQDGSYLGEAECLEAVGFDSTEAARQHGRARRAWLRAQKDMLAAERRMSVRDLAALHAAAETLPPPKPEARVVRPVFPASGSAALKVEHDQDERETRGQELMLKGLQERAAAAGRRFFVVPDEEEADGD